MTILPYELSRAVEGLNNEHRQKILFALKDVEKLSFAEILRQVDIEGSLLANHLRTLSRTLLVEHFYDHQVGNDKFSFYKISPFGKALLQNMLKTLHFRGEKIKVTILAAQIEGEAASYIRSRVLKTNGKIKTSESTSKEQEPPLIEIPL